MKSYKQAIKYIASLCTKTERAAASGLAELLFNKDCSEIAYDILKYHAKKNAVKIERG